MPDNQEKGILSFVLGMLGTWAIGRAITFALNNRVVKQQRYTKVGRHFTIDDFLVSRDFPRAIKKYRLRRIELQNLKRLVTTVLDPLAQEFGKPRVLSGGRPPSVGDFYTALRNRGYKPAKNGQHDTFAAADVSWGDVKKNAKIWEKIRYMPSVLQAIYYDIGRGRFHLSVFEPKRPRFSTLRLIKTEK
jgi:hypothetical protein